MTQTPHDPEISLLLGRAAEGVDGAQDELFQAVYDELRMIARSRMRSERVSHTLQPTALVHEAYLRLLGPEGIRFENRAHFFAAAAEAMRRVLVDAARARVRQKRGGGEEAEPLSDLMTPDSQQSEELLVLNDVISRLDETSPELGRVVKLRHFVGFSIDEVAEALEISPRTVNRQWNLARAWLKRELGDGAQTLRSASSP